MGFKAGLDPGHTNIPKRAEHPKMIANFKTGQEIKGKGDKEILFEPQ